jgi:hypothetical protein
VSMTWSRSCLRSEADLGFESGSLDLVPPCVGQESLRGTRWHGDPALVWAQQCSPLRSASIGNVLTTCPTQVLGNDATVVPSSWTLKLLWGPEMTFSLKLREKAVRKRQ